MYQETATPHTRLAKQFGPVSILVNNAGINRRNAFTADPAAVLRDWQDIMAINLNGTFNVTHAFLEPLDLKPVRDISVWRVRR